MFCVFLVPWTISFKMHIIFQEDIDNFEHIIFQEDIDNFEMEHKTCSFLVRGTVPTYAFQTQGETISSGGLLMGYYTPNLK